ncbi:hypothetical protein [Sphingosinithalassobacter portus]|uniref:hypothetical protein n=1 Tax=Stakelama portus TaxID=2676234 RepID=UPI0011AB2FFB|nr:hypothetical protein [Sphingosinithalassobacter portus]
MNRRSEVRLLARIVAIREAQNALSTQRLLEVSDRERSATEALLRAEQRSAEASAQWADYLAGQRMIPELATGFGQRAIDAAQARMAASDHRDAMQAKTDLARSARDRSEAQLSSSRDVLATARRKQQRREDERMQNALSDRATQRWSAR